MTPKNLLIIARLLAVGAILTLLSGWLMEALFEKNQKPQSALDLFPYYKKSVERPYKKIEPLELKSPFLQLADLQIRYKLPDVRSTILYHGNNERPDSISDASRILFSIRGTPHVYSALPKEKIWLSSSQAVREKGLISQATAKWAVIEKSNLEKDQKIKSALAILFIPTTSNSVTVQVEYTPPQTQKVEVEAPKELREFSIPISAPPIVQGESQKWKIAGLSVDSTLLEKQKASWFGKDVFMELLGDEAWKDQRGHERIQFGSGDEAYVIWAKAGDAFIFIDGKWTPEILGSATRGKDLLIIEEIQEKVLLMNLWSHDGSYHMPIQLTKKESLHNHTLKEGREPSFDMKIVGARTQNKWIAEIRGIRFIVHAFDWIFFPLDGKEPSIISSAEFIERYIEGKESGWLMIFQGVKRVQNDSCITGWLFNPPRSNATPVQISLYRSWKKVSVTSSKSAITKKRPMPAFESENSNEIDEEEDDEDEDLLEEDFDEE